MPHPPKALQDNREGADYASLLPRVSAIYEQTLTKVHSKPKDLKDCWISSYAAPKPGKPPQVRVDGVKYYVHIIACMHQHQTVPTTGMEASHLCNNAVCVRPDHLVFESGDVNKSRIYCRLFKKHPEFKCLHEPRCLGL